VVPVDFTKILRDLLSPVLKAPLGKGGRGKQRVTVFPFKSVVYDKLPGRDKHHWSLQLVEPSPGDGWIWRVGNSMRARSVDDQTHNQKCNPKQRH
jgi:hypothetical protein